MVSNPNTLTTVERNIELSRETTSQTVTRHTNDIVNLVNLECPTNTASNTQIQTNSQDTANQMQVATALAGEA